MCVGTKPGVTNGSVEMGGGGGRREAELTCGVTSTGIQFESGEAKIHGGVEPVMTAVSVAIGFGTEVEMPRKTCTIRMTLQLCFEFMMEPFNQATTDRVICSCV